MGRRESRLSVMSKVHTVTGRKLRIFGYISSGDSVPGRRTRWREERMKEERKREKREKSPHGDRPRAIAPSHT
jgi:hypothetical protein